MLLFHFVARTMCEESKTRIKHYVMSGCWTRMWRKARRFLCLR